MWEFTPSSKKKMVCWQSRSNNTDQGSQEPNLKCTFYCQYIVKYLRERNQHMLKSTWYKYWCHSGKPLYTWKGIHWLQEYIYIGNIQAKVPYNHACLHINLDYYTNVNLHTHPWCIGAPLKKLLVFTNYFLLVPNSTCTSILQISFCYCVIYSCSNPAEIVKVLIQKIWCQR